MSIITKKKYICQNCGNEFESGRECAGRTPKFCSRACAGYKKGNIPYNAGTSELQKYDKCVECGKEKTSARSKLSDLCQTCSNKKRAQKTVYYACPKCGKPKNERGRSDRVLCNSCARLEVWKNFFIEFGELCANKDYFGFTPTLKKAIRKSQNYKCAFCGDNKKTLDIHHIDYDKTNSAENNLIGLCRKCHMKTNFNRDYWKEKCQKIKSHGNLIE